jgi:hypothetical protein
MELFTRNNTIKASFAAGTSVKEVRAALAGRSLVDLSGDRAEIGESGETVITVGVTVAAPEGHTAYQYWTPEGLALCVNGSGGAEMLIDYDGSAYAALGESL